MELATALKSIGLLSHLPDHVLQALTPHCSIRNIRTGETIFCQGEPSPFCFGVLSGEVLIQRVCKDRRFPAKTLCVMTPGSLFGESSLFVETPRSAMASASRDGQLIVIRGSRMREWLQSDPQLGNPILMKLLETNLIRLEQTSHALSITQGLGNIFASAETLQNQLNDVLAFLKGSLPEVAEIRLYKFSNREDAFKAISGIPSLPSNPEPLSRTNPWVQQVLAQRHAMALQAEQADKVLKEAGLCVGVPTLAIVPLIKEGSSEQAMGLLCLAGVSRVDYFSSDNLLLLSAAAVPLSEALARLKPASN